MNIHPAFIFLAIFTIPAVYLFVEEREGRQLNPTGPSLFKRLSGSFQRKYGYILGAITAGLIVGLVRNDWPRGFSLAAFTVAATAMLTIHDAVRALKEDRSTSN